MSIPPIQMPIALINGYPVDAHPVVLLNPDNTLAGSGGSGGSAPTGSAGTPNAAVSSVQGVMGGTPLSVSDPQNASYTTWPTIAASGGTYTLPAGTRNLSVNTTTAGNISMTDGTGNVKTFPLTVGFQTLPFLPVTFTTTATATFWADK